MSKILSKQIIAELNNAHYNIDIDDRFIMNPFDRLRTDDPDEFYTRLTYLLTRPEYFSFICKHILNIELFPMQALILQEMWNRKFPMLVGSRGLGKLLRPDEKIRIKNGWTTMEKISVGDKVYGSDGKLCNVTSKTQLQKNVKMYRISLRDGRTIECCEDHMWKVWDKNKNKVKNKVIWSELKTKDMVNRFFWTRIGKKNSGKEYRFALPINESILEDDDKELPIHPYIIGVLLGDGCLTQNQITISSSDEEIVDRVKLLLPNGYSLKSSNNKDYRIVRTDKNLPAFHHLCRDIGIWGLGSHNKFIPSSYKNSGLRNSRDLLRGLMDTDGWSSDQGIIEYYTVSKQLNDDVLELIRSLGIQCKSSIKESWFNGDRYADCHRISLYTDKKVFNLSRKLTYLTHTKSKAGQSKYKKVFITNIEEIGLGEGYCIEVDSPDNTYITKDYIVTHNSFILSVYSILRALLMPNRKVVIVGAAFRQSKFLHDYMENIWRNAPILRDLCDANSGPRRDVDMCKMTFNGSTIVSLPIGDGCLSPDTQTTYDDCFGTIKDYTHKSIWGNKKFREIEYPIDNGIKPTLKITTKAGYGFEATHNHAMKIIRNGEIEWVRSDQMIIGDRILIDRSKRWHSGDFKCTLDQAYSLGAVIGDGCWTSKYKIGFASQDIEIIERASNGLFETVGKGFTQASDLIHFNINGKDCVTSFLEYWGLKEKCYTKDKSLPSHILSASREAMTACLQGLFDTDGHVFTSKAKGGTSVSVNFTNTSEILVKQIQYILLHYGIISKLRSRQRKHWNRVYELGIYGENVSIFAKEINFHLSRKRDTLNQAISERVKQITFTDNIPLPKDVFLKDAIIAGKDKTRMVKLKSYGFSLLEEIASKVDVDWKYLLDRDVFYDEIVSIERSECHTYDIHIPEGNEYCANGCFSHNSKIRGQRANDIIADEFASQSREIFETVIGGFTAVSANPVDNIKNIAKAKLAKRKGYDISSIEVTNTHHKSNQMILSGTASYDFNHFAEYWKRWKTIIESKGDMHKISNSIFKGEQVPDAFKWDDYSIIRIPVDLVPDGFMDDGTIARSKATIHTGIYQMEYGAVFTKDSQGFFKRTLIESCVGTDLKPVPLQSGPVYFDPLLKGIVNKKYVMAIDPASEVDNFSIIILELNSDHRRVVYCWTTTRKEHTDKVSKGLIKDNNFYSYCARKIRDLMDLFNIIHISMDSQGGGYSISEALHDTSKLMHGELPIWPIIDPDEKKPSDNENGLHILELCSFANYEWYSEANHGLRKDLEDKVILFPRFDPITIGLSIEEDAANSRLYDTLEDCVMEIEELKNELALIELTASVNGRERWDTPEVKVGVNKKKRMRKDRYSALIMANIAGRHINIDEKPKVYHSYGGFSSRSEKSEKGSAGFSGPKWFTDKMNGIYD